MNKQVIAIRDDLFISVGKIVAQAVHAAQRSPARHDYDPDGPGLILVVCKVKSMTQLMALKNKAEEAGLPYGLQVDRGHNEVAPQTYTAISIGPGPEEEVTAVTKRLQLLKAHPNWV